MPSHSQLCTEHGPTRWVGLGAPSLLSDRSATVVSWLIPIILALCRIRGCRSPAGSGRPRVWPPRRPKQGRAPHRQLKVRGQAAPASEFNLTKLHQDYAATASDAGVLQRPLKEELRPGDVRKVFGFPRNLRDRCAGLCAWATESSAWKALFLSFFFAQQSQLPLQQPDSCLSCVGGLCDYLENIVEGIQSTQASRLRQANVNEALCLLPLQVLNRSYPRGWQLWDCSRGDVQRH